MSSKRTSAASKKKGKLSKAEKLRLKREEEEKRQREEEEARLLAEQLEAERREKERQEKEERERLEAKQLEHRHEELEEHRALLNIKLEEATRWKNKLQIQAKWDRYMRCDGSPDPTIPKEINTFISLWAKEQSQDFQTVLNKSNLVLELIRELEFLLLDAPSDTITEIDVLRYQQTIRELQELLYQKFNNATERLLKNATVLSDIDTGNMQKVIKNENVTLCIWANLNKNPRFKGYRFEKEAIGFDLPKSLAVCSIAVRILHTLYDHLSCQSPTFHPWMKETEVVLAPTDELENVLGDSMQIMEEHKPSGSVITANEETKSEGRKSVLSTVSFKEEPKPVNESLDKTELETEQRANSQLGTTTEGHSPPSLLNDKQNDLLEDDVVDLRQYTTLGGVYYFDVIALPPQYKQVNGWTMVQILEGGLQMYPYPQDLSLLNLTGMSQQEKELENAAPPVAVSFRVPKNVFFFEEPQVARWDPEDKTWRMDSITQKIYNLELRDLSFKMDSFHTFTLIQDSHLNMPYESWELSPGGKNQVMLVIVSAFTEIQLEIKDDQCRLTSLSSVDGDLTHIVGKWMSPAALKSTMRGAGLNIFPEEDSAKYVIVNKKNEKAEKMAYEEMALLSASFAFGWSKWNHSCGPEQIVLKVKELSQPPTSSDESWSLYMLNSQRTQRLKISESSETFSDELFEHSELHSTLYHMIKDYASAGAVEALQHSHHLFVDCVYQLLSMTKVLTYS
ncbi:Hypothetical predicted protein [Pelobates cultripes]|uniref:Dynein axonemal intermediate chain 7 n=2 Tax=Pelobates cultripes TaxID=61616 RepID=A0AAD1RW29_PELCU|nr:Hypothetical predicted protein [Pelobates cultripes]